ncbi:MAG: hypothetical protein LBE35_09855, partial [Clostridiales bacterium]|nr:hypothetical protein [Clostridiales bacterium]
QNISVNVRQISTLEIGDIFIADFQQVGASIWLNFSVHNTSRSQIWNARVRFEGDAFDTSNADEPFGNMGAGFASFFMGTVTPLEPGFHTLYMVATFEDTMAEVHEIRRAFEINVGGGGFPGEGFPGEGGDFPGMPGRPGEGMENPECPECHNWFTIVDGECMICGWTEGGSFFADNLWIFIVGGGILIVAGGIITPLLIIRAKRKKSQFGGEQYDEVDEDF